MFFKKKAASNPDLKLSTLVSRNHETGYVFVDINNDLGDAAEVIMASSELIKMAYGYARRACAFAMYAQGLIDQALLDHVQMIFKGLQLKTGQSKEFQEAAYDEAIAFMQSYHWQLNRFSILAIRNIAENYDRPESGPISDVDLLVGAIDAAHAEQEDVRGKIQT